MERINTSDNALAIADAIIRELKENVCAVVSKHEATIKEQFDGIDVDFQNELLEYLEFLISFKNGVIEFETANSAALRDRITKISDYSSTVYKRRNI
jgi:hypothetical protein